MAGNDDSRRSDAREAPDGGAAEPFAPPPRFGGAWLPLLVLGILCGILSPLFPAPWARRAGLLAAVILALALVAFAIGGRGRRP